jgi:hypothetical protein
MTNKTIGLVMIREIIRIKKMDFLIVEYEVVGKMWGNYHLCKS